MPPPPLLEELVLALAAVVPIAVMLLIGLIRYARRRSWHRPWRDSAPVVVATVAAVACTAYSATTSWRFTGHHLEMHHTVERAGFFATGELALLANAVMARQNLRGRKQSAGLPGALLWVLAAVLTIPAYAEFGLVDGTWNGFFGPVMAAVLWRQVAEAPAFATWSTTPHTEQRPLAGPDRPA